MQKILMHVTSSINLMLLTGFISLFSVMLNGCGSEKEPMGSVKGTVTYKGSPLTEGLVNLYSDKKSVVGTAEIDSEGKFEFGNAITTGNYRVYISPPPPPAPPEPGQPPVKVPKPQKIPNKYRSADKTDLNITVKEGENDIPIQLID